MLAIEESSGDSDELKAAIFGLASEQSSFEKAMLYAISRHIDFPYRSPTLWMYFPSSNLLHEVSSAAEKRTIEHFPDKRFSDFVSSMNVYLLGDGDLDSKPESLSVAQSVQDPIEVKPKIEKSAESETPEPSEEPAEQSSQWWLLLIGAVVVVGGIGLMLRRKS
jgi:LPXTG-motif cell wall-anchored protein